MKKLLKHMNLFHIILLVIGGILLISALPFKTEYNQVYINVDANGITETNGGTTNARNQDQQLLWDYYKNVEGVDLDVKDAKLNDSDPENNVNSKVKIVYEFENALNAENNWVLVFGIVVIVGALVLMLLQNHKRKIYYGTNVAASVLVTIGIAVFAVIVLLNLFSLMGTFGEQSALFNNVALLQNSETRADIYQHADKAYTASQYALTNITFLVYLAITVLTVVYALFLLILTFSKFKRTAERRKEILGKAAENNND